MIAFLSRVAEMILGTTHIFGEVRCALSDSPKMRSVKQKLSAMRQDKVDVDKSTQPFKFL